MGMGHTVPLFSFIRVAEPSLLAAPLLVPVPAADTKK